MKQLNPQLKKEPVLCNSILDKLFLYSHDVDISRLIIYKVNRVRNTGGSKDTSSSTTLATFERMINPMEPNMSRLDKIRL
jgi:hypothetical protein